MTCTMCLNRMARIAPRNFFEVREVAFMLQSRRDSFAAAVYFQKTSST